MAPFLDGMIERSLSSGGRARSPQGGGGRRRLRAPAGPRPASAAPPLVQLAPAAAAMTAAIAAASSGEMRWPSTMSAASAAIAGSMLSSTP